MLRRRSKKLGASITLFLAVCTLTTRGDAGKAEDPTGAWKLKCVSPDGKPRECVVTLFREGEDLKGKFSAGRVTRPARDVRFDQGVLNFQVDGEFAGKAYTLAYKGKPRGDQLRGYGALDVRLGVWFHRLRGRASPAKGGCQITRRVGGLKAPYGRKEPPATRPFGAGSPLSGT